jgi:hypothetical protein
LAFGISLESSLRLETTRALFRALDPGDTGQDPALLSMSQAFDRRVGVAVEDPFPAGVLRFVRSGISRPTLQGEPPAFQDPLPPHGSLGGFFQSHGSSDAWKEFVWKDYMTQPAVLLPLGLAVSAVAISHWDRPLERKWNGVLGGRQTMGNIGAYTILGASLLIGVAMPGEGRNSWDELWTMAEA